MNLEKQMYPVLLIIGKCFIFLLQTGKECGTMYSLYASVVCSILSQNIQKLLCFAPLIVLLKIISAIYYLG